MGSKLKIFKVQSLIFLILEKEYDNNCLFKDIKLIYLNY